MAKNEGSDLSLVYGLKLTVWAVWARVVYLELFIGVLWVHSVAFWARNGVFWGWGAALGGCLSSRIFGF